MNAHPQPRLRPHAFTLVELLTVIAIIAILMGLLFPAISLVKEQARKAEAKTACTGIVAAVKAYNTEYGKYPVLDNKPSGDLWYGEKTSGAAADNLDLFTALRAKKPDDPTKDYNPRRIVFFEGKDSSSTPPKGGFGPAPSPNKSGPFFDPWGSQYNVIMDADYDNVITIVPHSDFKGATNGPQTGCVAFSLGKDNIVGSTKTSGAYKTKTDNSDDVISWQ